MRLTLIWNTALSRNFEAPLRFWVPPLPHLRKLGKRPHSLLIGSDALRPNANFSGHAGIDEPREDDGTRTMMA